MDDIMTIVKTFNESGLLIKGISKTVKNQTKEEKGGFVRMLLGTLASRLLGYMISAKEVIRTGEGRIRAVHDL